MDIVENVANFFVNYSSCFAIIGALSASYYTVRALCTIWRGLKSYFLSPLIGLSANLKSYGEWAVVTGSTDGIGKAYAIELARRGLNVVLISRSADKLDTVAKEIESEFHVKTKCIPVDFAGGLEIYEHICTNLSGMEIGILVNNVGMSYSFPQFLGEVTDDKELQNMININCCSVTFMSKLVLTEMAKRQKGIIINVSSVSGSIPTPLLTVYSATKAFVDFFSRALQAEYKKKGIIVQSVLPSFVATKLSKIRSTSWLIPNPKTYVQSALATVGVETCTCGYSAHALQWFLSAAVPEWLYMHLSMKTLLGARKRSLQKLQKTQ